MDETRFRVTQTNLEIQLPDMMKSVYGQSAQTLRDCTRVCAHSRARARVCVCVNGRKRQNKLIWRSQVRASSYDSNKLTNKRQQFHKFITWRLCVTHHVLGVSSATIRSLQLH